MAFAFVQTTTTAQGGLVTSIVVPITASTVNNLLVVQIKTSADPGTITITDNASTPNTYAIAGNYINGALNLTQAYGVQVTGGATSLTISYANSASVRVAVDEFSGGARSNAAVYDKSAVNSTTGTAASVTLSPTVSGELIVAGIIMGTSQSITAGSGYTAGQNTGTTTATQYKLSGTTSETAPATFGSTGWAEIASAFKPLAANPFAFIQTAENFAAATSVAVTIAAAGLRNLLIINVKCGADPGTIAVTDNVGNAYILAGTGINSQYGYQFYGVQTTAGATTITVTTTNSVNNRTAVDEYSGNAKTNALVFDKAIVNSGIGTTASASVAPTYAGSLVAVGFTTTSAATITPSTGYTVAHNVNQTVATQNNLNSTTSETPATTFSSSQTWTEIAGVYKSSLVPVVTVVQANYLANPSTIPAPVAGNLLVVLIRQTGSLLTPTVTDNLGGSYTVNTTKSIYNTNVDTVWAAYKYAVGGETTITTTPGTGGAAAVQVVYELNGAGNPLNIEVIANRDNQAFSTLSTTAAITASANDVILAAAALSGSQLPSAWGGTPTLTNVSVGTAIALISGYATITSGITAQAFVANWTGSRVSGNLVLAISPIATSSPGIPNAVGGGSMLMMGL